MTATKKIPTQIVVVDSGWVLVGQVSAKTTDELKLVNACVIRTWGATKGLGELVDGPLKSTVLDPCGTVHVRLSSVKFCIDCDARGWGHA